MVERQEDLRFRDRLRLEGASLTAAGFALAIMFHPSDGQVASSGSAISEVAPDACVTSYNEGMAIQDLLYSELNPETPVDYVKSFATQRMREQGEIVAGNILDFLENTECSHAAPYRAGQPGGEQSNAFGNKAYTASPESNDNVPVASVSLSDDKKSLHLSIAKGLTDSETGEWKLVGSIDQDVYISDVESTKLQSKDVVVVADLRTLVDSRSGITTVVKGPLVETPDNQIWDKGVSLMETRQEVDQFTGNFEEALIRTQTVLGITG